MNKAVPKPQAYKPTEPEKVEDPKPEGEPDITEEEAEVIAKKVAEGFVEESAKADKVELEQLPIHALRSACKEQGIKIKATDKKDDLIKMIRKGETAHKPREIKRAPQIEDTKTEKALPIIPKEIRDDLEALRERGLNWDIDEESGCINFAQGRLTACANLDQSARNILATANTLFGCIGPVETGKRPAGDPLEWV